MISIMNINKKILNVIYKVLAVMLALILWEIAALKIDSPIILVTPVQVLGRLFTIWHEPDFAGTVWFTMYHIVVGFLAGLLCGIVCAVLAHICKPVEYILWPWMVTIKAVPVASFVVICLIWFTAKNLSVFIAFLIVVPVIYQNTLTGLRSTDKGIREMAGVFHIPWIRRIRYIMMPQIYQQEELLLAWLGKQEWQQRLSECPKVLLDKCFICRKYILIRMICWRGRL